MIVISSTKLAKSFDGRAGAGLPSIIQPWPGRNSHEILPGLFLNWVIAGAAFAIRQLPGMAMFNPVMLSMAIGIAFHNIVGTAAWAKQGVTFSLRRLLGIVILPFGLYGALFVKEASTHFCRPLSFHSFVRPAPQAFSRPDRIFASPSRTAAVKDGASSAPPKACP